MKKKLLLQDLAELLATNEEIGKKEADTFVRAFFDIIEQGLLEDKFVKIKGLGTFKLVTVSERESVNINTGERFQINGHTKVTFTPDASMKELVNRPFAHFEAVDLNEDIDLAELEEFDTATETDDADESQEVDTATETDNADESLEVDTATETDNADESLEVDTATETDNADESQEVDTATETDDADESLEEQRPINETIKTFPDSATETTYAKTENVSNEQTDTAGQEIGVSAFENNQVSTTESDNSSILPATTHQPLNTGGSIEDYQQENPTKVSSSTDIEEDTEVIASKPMPINAAEENDSETTTSTDSDESPNGIQVTTTVCVGTENDTKDEVADNHTENLNTHLQLQDSPQQLSDSDNNEDDIVVTSPQHLTTNNITSHTTPTATNSIKYEYTEVPMPRKRNWWKISLISLCALLIMCCCYFAGYFRLLCPPCQFPILEGVFIPANMQHSHSSDSKPEQPANHTKSDTAQHHNPTLAAPATIHRKDIQDGTAASTTEQKASSTSNGTSAEPSAKDSADSGKNKPHKHVVRSGDTLLNISRRYYGNETYVKAIMKLNHLKDSNNIKVGLVLRLP